MILCCNFSSDTETVEGGEEGAAEEAPKEETEGGRGGSSTGDVTPVTKASLEGVSPIPLRDGMLDEKSCETIL